jgi:hypothetical protein
MSDEKKGGGNNGNIVRFEYIVKRRKERRRAVKERETGVEIEFVFYLLQISFFIKYFVLSIVQICI